MHWRACTNVREPFPVGYVHVNAPRVCKKKKKSIYVGTITCSSWTIKGHKKAHSQSMEEEQCWACLIRVKRANFKIFPKPDFLLKVGNARWIRGSFKNIWEPKRKAQNQKHMFLKLYPTAYVLHTESFTELKKATKTSQCCILPSVYIFWMFQMLRN